jgi:hypothetical protein
MLAFASSRPAPPAARQNDCKFQPIAVVCAQPPYSPFFGCSSISASSATSGLRRWRTETNSALLGI